MECTGEHGGRMPRLRDTAAGPDVLSCLVSSESGTPLDPPAGGVSCGNSRHGGIRLSRIPEDEADRPGRRPRDWLPPSASPLPIVVGGRESEWRSAPEALAFRWPSRARMWRRDVFMVHDSRTQHSMRNGVGDVVEYRRVPTGFFVFALDGCARAVDVSIGACGVGVGNRGISLFRAIAFTSRESRLDWCLVEASSRTVDVFIHGAVDRETSSTGIPVWRARSRAARSTVSVVGVASISARRVRRRVRVREMASCRASACCRRMMSR